jgi:hypothetical protein
VVPLIIIIPIPEEPPGGSIISQRDDKDMVVRLLPGGFQRQLDFVLPEACLAI